MQSRRRSLQATSRTRRKEPFETLEVQDLAELMKLAKDQRYQGFATIFRGQREDFPLVPKVGRQHYPARESIEVKPGGLPTGWHIDAEESGPQWVERTMLEQFERMAPSFTPSLPSDRWEILAMAQHHGLPTRLLDWTYNPYVAAWFTVGRPPSPGQGPGVLWIHVPDSNDYVTAEERTRSPLDLRRRSNRPLIFEPRYITSRIRAQDGVFTVQSFNLAQQRFLPIDEYGSHRQCMTKVMIPTEAFADMANELNYVGVNAASLFPDLDGLSRKIMDDFTSWD